VIAKMLTTVAQIKNINGTAKICDFLHDLNVNRSQITLDEGELCFKLENRCLVKNQNLLAVVAIDTVKHHQ